MARLKIRLVLVLFLSVFVSSFLVSFVAYGYVGISSYPKIPPSGGYSTEMIDDVIAYMDANSLNIYRMAFNPASEPDVYVHYYLENCNYGLIVDIYHEYPQGEVPAGTYEARLAKTLTLLESLNSSELLRIFIEPYNERDNVDLASAYVQPFINDVREVGYNVPVLVDRWFTQSWASYAAVNDTENAFYTGMHFYFNDKTAEEAEASMNAAIAAGIDETHLINTEVGADWNEYDAFDQSEVDDLNEFLQWCYDRDISNCVWMRYSLENSATYVSLGLTYPSGDPEPTPTPTPVSSVAPTFVPEVSEGGLDGVDLAVFVLCAVICVGIFVGVFEGFRGSLSR